MFEAIVRRGTLVAVAVLILSVVSVVAATRIPVQMIPDLEVRTVTVFTAWPGATPQDIEQEILIEQEEYLRNLPSLSADHLRGHQSRRRHRSSSSFRSAST